MNTKENRILTLEEVKEQGLKYFEYEDGIYEYKTEDGLLRLIINDVDVLEGKKAIECWYRYKSINGKINGGVYAYKANKYWNMIINNVNVLSNKKAIECDYYDIPMFYTYKVENDPYIKVIVNNTDILKGEKAVRMEHFYTRCYSRDYLNDYDTIGYVTENGEISQVAIIVNPELLIKAKELQELKNILEMRKLQIHSLEEEISQINRYGNFKKYIKLKK